MFPFLEIIKSLQFQRKMLIFFEENIAGVQLQYEVNYLLCNKLSIQVRHIWFRKGVCLYKITLQNKHYKITRKDSLKRQSSRHGHCRQHDEVSQGKPSDALSNKRGFLISIGFQGVVGSQTSHDLIWLSVSAKMEAVATTLNLTCSSKRDGCKDFVNHSCPRNC